MELYFFSSSQWKLTYMIKWSNRQSIWTIFTYN